MNIQIQSVKFDADKKLLDFVESKIGKLERFAEHSTGVEVTLKLDKDSDKGNKVSSIIVKVPGEDLFAERRAKTFEEATVEAIDAIRNQIDKAKEK